MSWKTSKLLLVYVLQLQSTGNESWVPTSSSYSSGWWHIHLCFLYILQCASHRHIKWQEASCIHHICHILYEAYHYLCRRLGFKPLYIRRTMINISLPMSGNDLHLVMGNATYTSYTWFLQIPYFPTLPLVTMVTAEVLSRQHLYKPLLGPWKHLREQIAKVAHIYNLRYISHLLGVRLPI